MFQRLHSNHARIGLAAVLAVGIECGVSRLVIAQTGCEVDKILASDGAQSDKYGFAVDSYGNTIVITTIGNNNDTGAAYVYTDLGDGFAEDLKLTAPDAEIGDWFGWSAAIDQNTIVIGAKNDDDLGGNAGAAHVYVRDGSSWSWQAKLLASDGEAPDLFGTSVDIDGDTIVVGAKNHDDRRGAAYVFVRDGARWIEQARLIAPDRDVLDEFGTAAVVRENTLVISSIGDDDVGDTAGAVYVYIRNGSTWNLKAKLVAPDGATSANFGTSLDLDGNTLVIGTAGDDDLGRHSGSAYVFTGQGGDWALEQKLLASDGQDNDQFGEDVCIEGNTVVVGAWNDDTTHSATGSVYVFHRSGTTWTQAAHLVAGDAEQSDNMGGSVSIRGDRVVSGAQNDDDFGNNSGAAYVFAGVLSDDGLALSGPRPGVTGRKNALDVRCATPSENVFFAYGFRSGSANVPGCPGSIVMIRNPNLAGNAVADVNGHARLIVFMPSILSGRTLLLQAVELNTCRESARVDYLFP